MDDVIEITHQPISVESVCRRFVPPECGATVTLDGYARRFTRPDDGEVRETEYLVYEAYEAMAVKEIASLLVQAKDLYAISWVAIVHRVGRLEIGETSVVISVAASHRRAAFEACEWLIKELKRTVPIWKKEVYAGGAEWVEGDAAAPNGLSDDLQA